MAQSNHKYGNVVKESKTSNKMGICITAHMEIHKNKCWLEGQHTLWTQITQLVVGSLGKASTIQPPKNDVANQMGYLWVGLPLAMSSTLPQKSQKNLDKT